jgi:hypothetical protein
MTSCRNRLTSTDFVTATDSDEFEFVFGGERYTGTSGDSRLCDFQVSRLAVPKSSPGIEPGLAPDLALEHPRFQLARHYEVMVSRRGRSSAWCGSGTG